MTKEALEAKLAAATPAPDFRKFPLLSDPEFEALVEEKRKLERLPDGYTTKSQVEARLKEIGEDIQALLGGSEVEAVQYRDGLIVKIGRGKSPDRIIPTRLLEQGVSIEQIAKATEEGRAYTFAQIVAPKVAK